MPGIPPTPGGPIPGGPGEIVSRCIICAASKRQTHAHWRAMAAVTAITWSAVCTRESCTKCQPGNLNRNKPLSTDLDSCTFRLLSPVVMSASVLPLTCDRANYQVSECAAGQSTTTAERSDCGMKERKQQRAGQKSFACFRSDLHVMKLSPNLIQYRRHLPSNQDRYV